MGKDGFAFFKNAFAKSDKAIMLSDEQLKKLQSVELDMLRDIVAVSNKYGINYGLSGGTALGAIRHGGFIPWDDDIDLNISRKDYEKLKKVIRKKFPDKYEICAPETKKGHGMSLAQMKKKGTIYQSFNEISKPDSGICIDFFILENTPDNPILRKLHGYLCLAVGYMLTCRKNYSDYPYLKEYIEGNEELKKAVLKKVNIGRLISWISLDRMAYLTYKVYRLCKNDNSKYVTIPSGRKHYFGEMALRSEMCQNTKIMFEDLETNLPEGIDNYMNRLYGDSYMEIPPEEKREKHPIMKIDFGE